MEAELVKRLVQMSRDSLTNSYCPYSQFPVGAALLCQDGAIYSGCNIETATFSGICAERTAYAKAIADGHRHFKAIAISTNCADTCTPCGNCRQFMAEFGIDLQVIVAKKDSTFEVFTLNELLPRSFGPKTLVAFQQQQNE